MATRTASKTVAERLAALEEENKRLAGLLAKRDDDSDKKKDDEDEDESRDGEDADEENAADEDDKKGDDEGDESRDSDDDDDDKDERAAPARGSKRGLTEAEVRKAAEAAVRADRVRGSKIREIAAQFGLPKLGERHANGETSVAAFKDVVLKRLAERQERRGSTTFAAAPDADLELSPEAGRSTDKGAAEARRLLGRK